MADLEGLRKRVEQIDLRLKTAHRAREKESAALMDTWEQIRERFEYQTAEITELRNKVAELEDARNDLLQMVHGLLSAVEGGLERISDETVPRIKAMASSLLQDGCSPPLPTTFASDETPAQVAQPQPRMESVIQEEVPDAPSFHDDLLHAIERSIESVTDHVTPDMEGRGERPEPGMRRPVAEPVSPGIRDLVERIETAVGPEFLDSASDEEDTETDEDELSRDLREIEALRGELNGLRQRISNGN